MNLRWFLFLLLGWSTTSCTLSRLYNQTHVSRQPFSSTFGFEKLASGHIIVPVVIAGKTYSFLLDTGSPNIVSKELAEELKLRHIHHQKYKDSQGNSLTLSLTQIDTLEIGGITFYDNATTIHDFEKSPPTIRCLNIAGVIGANTMKKAVWQIDFDRQQITITNTPEIPSGKATVLPFTTVYSGTPKVAVSINGVSDGKAYVDLGAKGFYKSSKRTLHRLCRKPHRHQCRITSGYGSIASGAFGYEKPDSSHVALVQSFAVGEEQRAVLHHQYILLSNHSNKLLGVDFFENYHTTIDWKKRAITLVKRNSKLPHTIYHSFGFRVIYQNDKLYVGFLYNDSPAYRAGLSLGDQIVKINEFDFEQPSEDKFCAFLASNTLELADQLTLTIIRKDSKQKETLTLYKKDLFQPEQEASGKLFEFN